MARARPTASHSGECGDSLPQSRAQMRQRGKVGCGGHGARHVAVGVVGDPVVEADRVQDAGAEPADRWPACQGHDRHALPQCLDRRRAGIVRKRIERDVDVAIGGPGAATAASNRPDRVLPASMPWLAKRARNRSRNAASWNGRLFRISRDRGTACRMCAQAAMTVSFKRSVRPKWPNVT